MEPDHQMTGYKPYSPNRKVLDKSGTDPDAIGITLILREPLKPPACSGKALFGESLADNLQESP
jgi:hypothetical protein